MKNTLGDELINNFIEMLRAERSISINTTLAYSRDLVAFSNYLTKAKKEFITTDTDDIVKYLNGLARKKFSNSTQARKLSAIKQFFIFLHDEGIRPDIPGQKLKNPKKPPLLPKNLTEKEIDKILEVSKSHGRNDYEKARNLCIVELLYASGMRVSELIGLPLSIVKGEPDFLMIQGKGAKERIVPLSQQAKKALNNWLAERNQKEVQKQKKKLPKSPFLFPSPKGTAHLSRVSVFNLMKDLARSAGVPPEKVSPHTLRHTFATHLLTHGADLKVIQELLGHEGIGTTEIYTHVVDENLRNTVLTKHPLSKDSDPPDRSRSLN